MDTHERISGKRNDGIVPAVIPCRPRCSTEASHQIHHKLGWKAINIDAKHVIFRCDGICKDNPKYTVHTVGDPRNPLTRFRTPEAMDLLIPSFVLDNNSVGPQPKREVSIFGLNDNINHTFLSDMCQKTGSVIEVLVYKHPRTKKHLGMAYVVFQDVGKADSFVAKNSGTSVMGQIITCIVDPYANEISRCYEEQAMEAAPIPRYLSRLDFDKLLKFRKAESESLLGRKCFLDMVHPTSSQRPTDVMVMELKTEKQKQYAEVEAAFQFDKCKHLRMEPAKAHAENVLPSVAPSSTPSSEHFSTPTVSLTNPSCPPASLPLAAAPRFSAPFLMNQHHHSSFGCYRSVSSNPVSQPGFSQVPASSGILPPLPPPPLASVAATGKPSFLPCSDIPPPPPPAATTSSVWPQTKTPTLITPLALPAQGPVMINSTPAAPYSVPNIICQSVPSTSTSICEEIAPMDPAPSKKSKGQERRKEIFTRISGRDRATGKTKIRRKKGRHRISSSLSSVSPCSSDSDDGSGLSDGASEEGNSFVYKKRRHREEDIIEKIGSKRRGSGGTTGFYRMLLRKNDGKRYCARRISSNSFHSSDFVDEVHKHQRDRKYKKRQQEKVEHKEHFLEPDVDLPDLESVSSDDDEVDVQHERSKVQLTKRKSCNCTLITSAEHTYYQSRHVDWRKRRIMEKRRWQRGHWKEEDREGSSGSGDGKGHRWSSSSSNTESHSETDEQSFRNTKNPQKRMLKFCSSERSQPSNLSDMVEAVTASSEESHDDQTPGTSGILQQRSASFTKNFLTKNDSTHSLSTIRFITSSGNLLGDPPLPCFTQPTLSVESPRPSFERRLEKLLLSSSMQFPISETHEGKTNTQDTSGTSFSFGPAVSTPQLPSTVAPNNSESKGMSSELKRSSITLLGHSDACSTGANHHFDGNFVESWTDEKQHITTASGHHHIPSQPTSFEVGVSSPVDGDLINMQEENRHSDEVLEIQAERSKVCKPKFVEKSAGIEPEEFVGQQINEKKRAIRENYVHAMYMTIREDMKNVLVKDLMRKIESIAFENLERRWKEREKTQAVVEQTDDLQQNDIKFDATTSNICVTNVSPVKQISSKDSLNEVVRQVTEQARAEMSVAFGPETAALLGTGLFFKGLGIARNMPSFKKKRVNMSPRDKRRSRITINRFSRSPYSRLKESGSSSLSSSQSHSFSCTWRRTRGRRKSKSSEAEQKSSESDYESERSSVDERGPGSSTCYSSSMSSGRKRFDSGTNASSDAATTEGEEDEDEENMGVQEGEEKFREDSAEVQINVERTSTISEMEATASDENMCKEPGAGSGSETFRTHATASYFKRNSLSHVERLEQRNIDKIMEEKCDYDATMCNSGNAFSLCSGPRILGKSDKKLFQRIQPRARKAKTRRYRNELMSLLPPSINAEDYALGANWRPEKQWERRIPEKEEELLWKFEREGLDAEDLMFLERAFYEMQNDGTATWDRTLYWVPARKVPEIHLLQKSRKIGRNIYYYDDPELEGVVPHSTGCARTEGYYKLSHKEKRGVLRRPDVFLTEISEKDEEKARHMLQSTREARSMNRRLLTSMGDTSSDILKVNQLKYRKKLIKFARSRIHGWGLYALEAIAPDEMIVEYIGQKIRPTVADEREKRYERRGMGSSYLFRIDSDNVIDATQMGNLARFINHSCQPNCYAKIVAVDGEKRIVIYSKIYINKGDEITYDYKFPIEEDKIDCLCGAPGCRGSLN